MPTSFPDDAHILARIAIAVGDITDPRSLGFRPVTDGPPDEPTATLPGPGVDAIVNAANQSLLGGAGVDGTIHRAAGPRLLQHNRALGGCPTGLAKRTPAFDLEAQGIRHIIHTVGPVWPDEAARAALAIPGAPEDESVSLGNTHADVLLASCYTQALALATQHAARHLAIPAISTGVHRFPKPRAARIAFGHVHGHLARHDTPHRVTLVCFSPQDADLYHHTITSRAAWMLGRKRA